MNRLTNKTKKSEQKISVKKEKTTKEVVKKDKVKIEIEIKNLEENIGEVPVEILSEEQIAALDLQAKVDKEILELEKKKKGILDRRY